MGILKFFPRFTVCLVRSGPSVYEFPRKCISVNPRACISVNSTISFYACPRKCISVNPRKCISVKSTITFYACPRGAFPPFFDVTYRTML